MDWLKDSMWLVWLGGALTAGVLELASLDFVFAMVAGGAVVAAGSAAIGAGLTVQVLVFAGASAALLFGVRPFLKRWAARSAAPEVDYVASLVNQPVVVLSDVTGQAGTVKLKGETWTARVADPGTVLPAGSHGTVVRIDGATALVRAALPPGPQDDPAA